MSVALNDGSITQLLGILIELMIMLRYHVCSIASGCVGSAELTVMGKLPYRTCGPEHIMTTICSLDILFAATPWLMRVYKHADLTW